MENILLIRLKSIGDVLFTLPAVHMVRKNFPEARLHFLVSAEHAPLLRGFREVDGVIALDRAALSGGHPLKAAGELWRLWRRLRAGEFSLVVDFQGYGETAWLTRLTGAPRRWGSVYGPGRAWAYTQGVPRNDRLHLADWNLSLLEQCGLKTGELKNEFILPDEALDAARRFFSDQKLEVSKPTLFIQPFTSTPFKNWPLENFVALALHFQANDVQIIFGGGPFERAALEPARAAGFTVAAGTPLLVSAGLAKLSSLVVSGDTGLPHLAVAMGKRVLMMIHSITPGCTHPFRHPDWTVTPPAGQPVEVIPVAAVIGAAEQALAELNPNSGKSS